MDAGHAASHECVGGWSVCDLAKETTVSPSAQVVMTQDFNWHDASGAGDVRQCDSLAWLDLDVVVIASGAIPARCAARAHIA